MSDKTGQRPTKEFNVYITKYHRYRVKAVNKSQIDFDFVEKNINPFHEDYGDCEIEEVTEQ